MALSEASNRWLGWLLQAQDVRQLQRGYGSLVFTGVFFLVCIVAAIWWLRR